MTTIRCIYRGSAPDFPATDQHPSAMRYGPLDVGGKVVFVDAVGGEPTLEEIAAILKPPAQAKASEPEVDAAAGPT